ncbi:trigger factor [Nakamurella sp. A5-74]|uniref:Trigger factor n=1 Tax=Nakamurella sp. A5-74 TaxID=3158264 RepID=A0AAU8DTU0_9ACTN
MKSSVEHLNPTRVKLTVEVPFSELDPQFDAAYKAMAGQVNIPGFRKGKVPPKILESRIGRGAILSEVVNDAIPTKYGEAVEANNLTPLGQPDIEVTKLEDKVTLEFTAEVDVRPEITLPAINEITVTVDDISITDDDVEEQVTALRERFAANRPVERAAADGDLISIDLRAAVDGAEIADASADDLSYTVGTGDLVEGIDEAVTGLSAGDSTTFTTKLVAGEYDGQDADVTVTVKKVSERELPEVDDEFAQLASEFDNVDEMRADLRERITRVRKMSQGADARDKVLEALVAITEIPVPSMVLEAEIEARAHDAVHSFDHNEEALTAHIESEGKTREEFDEEIREASVEAVKTQLLLDKLAEVTEVGVSQEEFTQRILYNAQRFGLSPDEYFQRLQEANQLGSIFADVRRGKALAVAVSQATITDASGNALDIDELFGVEDVEDERDDESGVEVDEDGIVTVDADTETDTADAADSEADENTSLDKS